MDKNILLVFLVHKIILSIAVDSAGLTPLPSTSSIFSAEEDGKRLIQISESIPARWLSQEEIDILVRNYVFFIDVTNRNYPTGTKNATAATAFPASLRFQSTVRGTFSKINIPRMKSFVTTFSEPNNRYYNSLSGLNSSSWLYSQVDQSLVQSKYKGNATVRYFPHSWAQKSIIARIEGSENGVVILGAHQDSINRYDRANGVAPGADDNASGSATILETFRVLLESGYLPKKSIEFHWYAAEEVGLRGSQDIAQDYHERKVDVISMLNYDVIGYNGGTNEFSFVTDYADSNLNTFLQMAGKEILQFNFTDSKCGYGCSDHASWTMFGFPAAMPYQPVFPSLWHTQFDTIKLIDFTQLSHYTKLALGYCIEISEPIL